MLGKETVTAKLVMSLREMDQVVKTKGPGKGQGAGDATGEDYYEAEVSILELEQAFFRELELPNLKEKKWMKTGLNMLNLMTLENRIMGKYR